MVDNDDVYFIGERLKLERETERERCFLFKYREATETGDVITK